jgi:hypothetical protein
VAGPLPLVISVELISICATVAFADPANNSTSSTFSTEPVSGRRRAERALLVFYRRGDKCTIRGLAVAT